MRKQKKKEMKKKIRKTGEIVDVISYVAPNGAGCCETGDFVSYVDSKGRERKKVPLNYFWDLEDIDGTEVSENIDWERRRYEISKSCINGVLANEEMTHMAIDEGLKKECRDIPSNIVKMAVAFADALIAELKKGGEK